MEITQLMSSETLDPSNEDAHEWARRLGAKGWGTPTWPAEYGGGGLSQLEAKVLNEELDRAGAFNPEIDATHVIVSLIGVHFMPFAVGDIVERFMGTSPFHASFVEDRKAAVRMQVRDLVLDVGRQEDDPLLEQAREDVECKFLFRIRSAQRLVNISRN